MAKASRTRSTTGTAKSAAPIGGRYYTRHKSAVSGRFIESLKDDGVSGGTIHAIRKDNAKREAASGRGAADVYPPGPAVGD
jgi:hypothetical protein